MILDEATELHNELNPKLWTSDAQLRPEVREKLLEVVNEVKETFEIDLEVIDALLVGSNASYNYTEKSDIDLHIIVDSELVDASKPILALLYQYIKSKFNSNYEITIHGIPVEIYLEDTNTSTISNGVYSVLTNKWIKFPQKITPPDVNIDDVYNVWVQKIDSAIANNSKEELQSLRNQLYVIRRNSINNVGEFGRGNLLFKKLRDNGYLDKLKDTYLSLVSSDLSLEAFKKKIESEFLNENTLEEDSRLQLIQKSRSSAEGSKRYKNRLKSKVLSSPKNLNNIDMNKLFTNNILTVDVDVRGESDTYTVKISFGGFLDIIHDQLKRSKKGVVDLRMITKALITGFNRNDVYIHCSCPDFQYRYSYFATKNDINSGAPENRPSDINNPNDTLGSACKHVLCVMSNTSWLIKVALVISNYIKYMKKYEKKLYQTVIYPALYQTEYVEPTTDDETQENNTQN